jgi:hypothetical protein
MNRRKASVPVLNFFSVPHFFARPDFSNQTPEKLRGITRNQLLVARKGKETASLFQTRIRVQLGAPTMPIVIPAIFL